MIKIFNGKMLHKTFLVYLILKVLNKEVHFKDKIYLILVVTALENQNLV